MTIKYAARGISTQMRTAEELLFIDGVTLKPVDGGDVFVEDDNNGRILVGTGYNASSGGCTVNGTVFESDGHLEDNYYYVISSAFSAYNLLTETLVYFGYNDYRNECFDPDYFWSDPSDLSTAFYRTDTIPTQTPVWKISDGTTGTRYTGSNGDAVVKDAGGLFSYYATVSACDAVWTTEEPTIEVYFTNLGASGEDAHYSNSSYTRNLYDADGNLIPYDSSKTYTVLGVWYKDGTEQTYGTVEIWNENGNLGFRVNGYKVMYSATISIS